MQLLLNKFSELFGLQNLAFRAKAEYPAFDLIETGDSEAHFQAAIGQLRNLLALVPDLLPYPPGPAGGDSDLRGALCLRSAAP